MLATTFTAILGIFLLLVVGIGVDRLYRAFARRHPRLGPYRSETGGCGCCGEHCADDKTDGHCRR